MWIFFESEGGGIIVNDPHILSLAMRYCDPDKPSHEPAVMRYCNHGEKSLKIGKCEIS